MRKANKRPPARDRQGTALGDLIYWLAICLLIAVPLAFSTLVYTKYSLPKFVVLLIGSSLLAFLLVLRTRMHVIGQVRLRSPLVTIVFLYFGVVAISTIFGVAPVASLFGSHFNLMGLITRLCFLVVFLSLIAGIGLSEKKLRATLWGIAVAGFFAASYGVAQAFGVEPFVSPSLYTFESPEGPLVRVSATLGHSNYLGNFLLYTTPVCVVLALAGRGWSRLFAIAAAVLSVAAIVFSGTRGAWIGIVAGGVTFAIFEIKSGAATVIRDHSVAFGVTLLLALLLALMIVISPASRSAGVRMKSLLNEGASSSGRTLLWRDSLKMVPAFSVIGCGPEGFRKAALGFKSRELAQVSPNANNESPHNAYLDVAISNGLLGAALYVAMIVVALRLLIRARWRLSDRRRLLITGLVSSLVAALVHNVFIFDQIATGLYFFVFIALAQATSNVAMTSISNARSETREEEPTHSKTLTRQWKWNRLSGALVTGASFLVVGSVWYSAGVIRSEMAYRELFDPQKPVDFEKLVQLGVQITSSPLPTGSYHFAFARACENFIRKLPPSSSSTEGQLRGVDVNAIRNNATDLAIKHVEKSLTHTLTPDLNYLLLASLALGAGDVDKLRYAASEGVRWDPNNYQIRCLMAEAHIARGEREHATREAQLALDLCPTSTRAASTLARARGTGVGAVIKAKLRKATTHPKRSVEALIEMSRALTEAGLLEKAQNKLLTAIRRAGGQCADCHRELAAVYERMERYTEAITQWEAFIGQAPEDESVDHIRARIEALRQKNSPEQ